MRFSIITLFPNLIKSYFSESIIKKALEKNKIQIEIIDLRQNTPYSHNQVDDYQFGGGKGMVLMVEPVVNAINSCRTSDSLVILTSPQGRTLKQKLVKEFCETQNHLIIVCGHYEGFDERILDYVDMELSIGDYVITGGELASLIVVDSITRLVDGVIAKESHQNDSFENNLLDYCVYTRPVEYDNKIVPEILLSGHHANIEKFRHESRLKNTFIKRPDLLEKNKLSESDLKYLKSLEKKMKGE